jgi:hypothetical protein
MPVGPGKYDDLATLVRETTNAQAVVLIIVEGDRGSGFSVQALPPFVDGGTLVKLLRDMADQIEEVSP